MSRALSKPLHWPIVALVLLASACRSGYDHAVNLEGIDPVLKSEALLHFMREESEGLEPETRDVLRDMLRGGERNPLVRAQCALVLGRSPPQPEHYEWLLSAMDDESHHVRFDVVIALTQLGKSAEPAVRTKIVEAFAKCLKEDRHSWVRMKAARGLGELGDRAALPALIDALRDDDRSVVHNAHRALVTITGEALPPRADDWAKHRASPSASTPAGS